MRPDGNGSGVQWMVGQYQDATHMWIVYYQAGSGIRFYATTPGAEVYTGLSGTINNELLNLN